MVQIMEVPTDISASNLTFTRPERPITLWIPKATNTVSYTDEMCKMHYIETDSSIAMIRRSHDNRKGTHNPARRRHAASTPTTAVQ